MKQLILVRHGKSSWDYHVDDRDRPLTQRGINDGHLVSETFRQANITVDAIYSSPANRALHTCTIFLRNLKFPEDRFRLSDELYEFSGEGVMSFVRQMHDRLNTVMIFGHNHAFTNVANQWGNTYIDNVPTTGLAQLEFDVDSWAALSSGTTIRTLFPNQLRK
jgi:phosphohistidine phosphatase